MSLEVFQPARKKALRFACHNGLHVSRCVEGFSSVSQSLLINMPGHERLQHYMFQIRDVWYYSTHPYRNTEPMSATTSMCIL